MWQRLTNQITALTNQIVELHSRVKTNLRLLPTSTDVYNTELIRQVELDLNNNTELAPAEDDPEETPPQYLPSFKIEVSKPQVNCYRSLRIKMSYLLLANVDQIGIFTG